MISPTRMPSCLSVLAASLSGFITMAALPAALYGTGCGSGFVTGDVGLGRFGGGGVAGSFVGATGSSSGMTVYRLIGSPIRATVTSPYALHAYSSHIAGRRQRGRRYVVWGNDR